MNITQLKVFIVEGATGHHNYSDLTLSEMWCGDFCAD